MRIATFTTFTTICLVISRGNKAGGSTDTGSGDGTSQGDTDADVQPVP